MLIRPLHIQRVTLKEAALLVGCSSAPLGQEARIRLMVGNARVRAFSPADVRHILGDKYTERLTASSVSWRNALTSLTGTSHAPDPKVMTSYCVVIDVDALQAIIERAEPVLTKGMHHTVATTGAPTARPH